MPDGARDNSKVTVRMDENGNIIGLDIAGDIDRSNLTEERPSKPPPSPLDEEFLNQQNVRWAG